MRSPCCESRFRLPTLNGLLHSLYHVITKLLLCQVLQRLIPSQVMPMPMLRYLGLHSIAYFLKWAVIDSMWPFGPPFGALNLKLLVPHLRVSILISPSLSVIRIHISKLIVKYSFRIQRLVSRAIWELFGADWGKGIFCERRFQSHFSTQVGCNTNLFYCKWLVDGVSEIWDLQRS